MAHLHLVVGPVGAGKSTWARRFAEERPALFLEMDAWVSTLFGEAPASSRFLTWYTDCAERCLRVMWQVAEQALQTGSDVVLELGFVRRREREVIYELADRAGIDLVVVVLDAPRSVRWKRVERRNAARRSGPALQVEASVFARVSDLWEPPDEDEVEKGTARRAFQLIQPRQPWS